jgi:hypothetical protein
MCLLGSDVLCAYVLIWRVPPPLPQAAAIVAAYMATMAATGSAYILSGALDDLELQVPPGTSRVLRPGCRISLHRLQLEGRMDA